ncbi:MAG: 16S rRNA (cytidine(1402)-2'-O)-methyltransferase [Alphaproteobacteria bacterium]|nr:16S rRNA (cytidine(1402)-2'-O)-methyltransferase [Alphaproteobacteria bacterium]
MLDCGLYVVATPIGNLNDISARALDTLNAAEIIACEDTRVTKKLFALLGISIHKNFICYQNYNEEDKAAGIVDIIKGGQAVALVSDAGSPLISDPGYKLVSLCRKEGVKVYSIPGASAVICALQLAGLPTNRFMFAGFIPNKDKARADLFNELKSINTTLVLYETAPRLLKTLQAAGDVFGTREMVVVREITKLYEDARNGTAQELAQYYTENPAKGEIVLVIAPPCQSESAEIDVKNELLSRLQKMSLKSAVEEVTALSGLSKKEVYNQALALKDKK